MATTLQELLVRIGADITPLSDGLRGASDALGKFDRETQKAFGGFDKLGARLTSVGAGLTAALTLPIAGLGAASIKMAGDFESSMNKVQALGDITGKALADLEAQALDLGAKTKFSSKEAADGMAALAAAGLNASQVTAAMPAILALAAAGEISVGQAAQVAAETMGEFGIKAEGMGHAVDVIAKAAASGTQSVDEMSISLKYVGPVAKAAGLSFEEVSAAITLLANAGIKGSDAGTALRGAMARLLDPSKEAADAMKQLGLNVTDAQGKLKPLADIIEQIGKSGATTGQIFKIFGQETASGISALVSQGAPALRKLTGELEHADGAAKKMADTLNQGIKGAFEKATGSIETAGIAIGKALGPLAEKGAGLIEALANKVTELVVEFGKLPLPVQQAAIGMVAMAAAVGPVLLGLGALSSSVTSIAGAITALGSLGAAASGVASLGTALAVAGPLAVAFGVAVAGWAIYTAITEVQKLDAQISQLQSTLEKGGKATAAQAAEIAALETTLRRAGKAIPEAFDFNNNLKSVDQYVKDLRGAVGQLDEFKGKAVAATLSLKGGAVNIANAASEYLGLGTAAASASVKIATGAKQIKASSEEAGKAVKSMSDQISDSFRALGVKDSTFEVTKRTAELTKAYRDQIKAYEAGEISSTDLARSYAGLRDEMAKLNGINPDFAEKWNAQMKRLDEESAKVALNLQMAFGKAHDAIVAESLKPIEINWQVHMPAEVQQALKDASESAQKLDNALKLAGVSQDNLGEKARALATAYDVVQAAVESGTATQMQADQVRAKALEAQIAYLKSIGESTAAAESQLDKVNESLVKHGEKVKGLKDTWADFSKEVSTIITNFAQNTAKTLFDGTKDWGAKFTALWKELATAVTAQFLTPVTKALTEFFTSTLTGLLQGKGLAAFKDAISELGDSLKGLYGIATKTGGAVKSAASGAASGAGVFMGDTSEAAYDPAAQAASGAAGSAGSAGGAAGGLSSFTPMGIVSAGIDAAGFVAIGLLLSRVVSTLGKVEVNTREMSVTMWQTGAESLQGIGKRSLNELIYIGDRLNEIRDSLFDPVTVTLEGIWQTLKSGITVNGEVGSGSGEGGTTSTTAAFRQPGVGDPNFGPPKYQGFVGAVAGGATAKESLSELTRQLADANAQLEKVKADRKVYASELNSMSTGVDRRKELAAIDAVNSDKQQGFEGTIKALQYTLDQLSKAVGRGTAEVTQGITSLDGTIQASALVQGTAAADTAAAIQAMADAVAKDTTFVEGNQGTGTFQIDLSGKDIWGKIGDAVDTVGNTLMKFSDAVQNTAQSIASSVASLVPPMNFSDSPLPALGSQIVPTITQQPYQNMQFRDFGIQQKLDGRPLQVQVMVDGREIGNALVSSLEMQGLRN